MAAAISGSTKVLALLGHPVAHSLSPRLHNAACEALGLDMVYVTFDVEPAALPAAVDGLRALGVAGANVTVPHKERVAALLDTLEGAAASLRTVNTIVNRDGRLSGHNTDVAGFSRALCAGLPGKPAGSRYVVFGAGGAARAVVWGLVALGAARVSIYNRTHEKAVALAAEARNWASPEGACEVEATVLSGLAARIDDAQVVVNATSVGLESGLKDIPFPVDSLSSKHTVMDLVYDTQPTVFLQKAGEKGAHLISGVSMLLEQAALSFTLWTGRKPPLLDMKRALELV
jgi:shikimate dehydrogenase